MNVSRPHKKQKYTSLCFVNLKVYPLSSNPSTSSILLWVFHTVKCIHYYWNHAVQGQLTKHVYSQEIEFNSLHQNDLNDDKDLMLIVIPTKIVQLKRQTCRIKNKRSNSTERCSRPTSPLYFDRLQHFGHKPGTRA